jgi:hypothetical protein
MVSKEPFNVSIALASKKSLQGFGTIVTDFENTRVEKRPWPVEGE